MNKWIDTSRLPEIGQTVYFYGKYIGMFIGRYDYQEYRYGGAEVFLNEYGVFNLDDVSHWRDYDPVSKNIVPLPPSDVEEIPIPPDDREIKLTAVFSAHLPTTPH